MNTGRTAGTCRGAPEWSASIVSGTGRLTWPVIAIVALLCMVAGSASYPFLAPDEARHAGIVHDMWAARQYLVPRVNGFPTLDGAPLHYWVSLLFLALFGPYEWVLRLPSALAAVALLLVVGKVFVTPADRRGATRLALLFLIQPALLIAGRFATPDMLSLLLLTVAVGGFLRVVQHREQGRESWSALCTAWGATGLLGLSAGMLAVMLPLLTIGLWLVFRRRIDLLISLRCGVGVLTLAILVLPWLLWVESRHPGIVPAMLHKQAMCLLGGARHGWVELGHGFCALLVFAGVLPLYATLARLRRPALQAALRTPLAGLMAVWLLVLAPLHVLMTMSPAGHVVALVVPLLYFGFLAMQPDTPASRWQRMRPWCAPVLLAAVLAAAGTQFLGPRVSGMRPLAQTLSQHYNPATDKAIMLGRYDYDFNFHLRSPKLVYVATEWENQEGLLPYWKQGFMESARFVPETAARMLLNAAADENAILGHDAGEAGSDQGLNALFGRLCERRSVNLWVIGAADSASRYPILDSFPLRVDTPEVRVWYLSAGREPRLCVAWTLQRWP